MLEINGLRVEELVELKNKIDKALEEKLEKDDSFYSKILRLKLLLSSLEGKKFILNVDGDDGFLRLEFEKSVDFIVETFDHFPIKRDEYNKDGFDQLLIESSDQRIAVIIPLFSDFIATDDDSILKDGSDDQYENVLLVIRLDTIDYIFTEETD